jgi:hypothetical protein
MHHPIPTPATHPIAIAIHTAIAPVVRIRELFDHVCELQLQDFDALAYDGVGLQVTDGLDVEVEFGGGGGVVEGLVGGGGFFHCCVFGLRPDGTGGVSYLLSQKHSYVSVDEWSEVIAGKAIPFLLRILLIPIIQMS